MKYNADFVFCMFLMFQLLLTQNSVKSDQKLLSLLQVMRINLCSIFLLAFLFSSSEDSSPAKKSRSDGKLILCIFRIHGLKFCPEEINSYPNNCLTCSYPFQMIYHSYSSLPWVFFWSSYTSITLWLFEVIGAFVCLCLFLLLFFSPISTSIRKWWVFDGILSRNHWIDEFDI